MFRAVKLSNSVKCVTSLESLRCFSATSQKLAKSKPATTNSSFVHNIFRGKLEASQLTPFPIALNSEQIEFVGQLLDPMTKFFTEVNDPDRNDRNEEVDKATLEKLAELGGFGLQVPQEYGGVELSNTQYGRLAEIIGMHDLGLSVMMGAHQSIGFKGILLYGTKEQKEKYLPMLASGEHFAAFALTEPTAGSDAASIRTRAVRSADGGHYTLNGSKIWISNGGFAEVMTVFARTEVRDGRTGETRDKVTAFIVERGFGGVTNGPPEKKLGIKCSNTAEVYFEDVRVPAENVLGGEGNGFTVAMNILNNGRFGMGMALGGTMRMAIQKASEHATQRRQFGRRLHEFQGVQEKLARMATLHYVNQSMAYLIAANMDLGSHDYHLEAAISKVFASESAWHVCDEAIQILGGMGFMRAPGLERFLRDLRIFRIFEGTNDILRLFVALTGVQYAGAHLRQLQRALRSPASPTNAGLLLREAAKRTGLGRIFGGGGGAVNLGAHVDASLAPSAQQCSASVELFARSVERLLRAHGERIVDEQFLLNRLADSAIDIYAMAAALSRASRSLHLRLPSAEQERLMTQNWCLEASDRVRHNLARIHSQPYADYYRRMADISGAVCERLDLVHTNPLGV